MSIRRDYKPASTWQRRRQVVRRHGLLVITLVLIGLFAGLLAYIRQGGQPSPSAATAPATPARPPVSAAPAMPKPPAQAVPAQTVPTPAGPKYDFYTELPKRQIEIRRGEAKPQSAPPTQPNRTQPAAEPLRKPAAPKKNTATPTVAAAGTSTAKPVKQPRSSSQPSRTVSPPSPVTRPPIAAQTD